jgi:hypothetical protein
MSRLLTRGVIQQFINSLGGEDWTLTFNNIDGTSPQTTNTETIQGNITLFFEFGPSTTQGNTSLYEWIKNSTPTTIYANGYVNQTLSFLLNDTIAIKISNSFGVVDGSILLKENDTNGRIVAEIFFYVQAVAAPCYLTTACVEYKGLADDGPELTAMRTLREYYRGDEYYDNLINEYYEKSPIILNNIPKNDFNIVMDSIYDSVKLVESYVSNNDFQLAKDEYLNLYFKLRNQYNNI